MSVKKIFFPLIAAIIVWGCGPTAEEKAAIEKAKLDSVATVTRHNMETKIALQDSIKNWKEYHEQFKYKLSETKGELAAAEDRLTSIRGFEFLRSASEREQQIKTQTMFIDELQNRLTDLENAIQQSENNIRYYEAEERKY